MTSSTQFGYSTVIKGGPTWPAAEWAAVGTGIQPADNYYDVNDDADDGRAGGGVPPSSKQIIQQQPGKSHAVRIFMTIITYWALS